MTFYVTSNIGDDQDIGKMGTIIGSIEPSGDTSGGISLRYQPI